MPSFVVSVQDSTVTMELDSVVVKAFNLNGRLRNVPAAVSFISRNMLQRFGTASVVEAVNTLPGVRMEERSPGSYRFNIRGSALRAPFGVRNIKIYYNDLPLTDPGGQTYLNSLGNYDYGSVEVIKGPGSSFYGAGTGGVLLINSIATTNNELFFAEHTAGSYGLQNSYVALSTGNENFKNRISFQHQQSNGYRSQSAMDRNVVNWSSDFIIDDKNILKTTFLYSDLYYQTPGALTEAEFNTNPKAARPAAGPSPGAAEAQAAIFQQTFLAGISYTQHISERMQNKTVAYGAYTKLENPAIRNYGRNSEPHAGARTVFTWNKLFQKSMLTINAGAEWQQGFATLSAHKNKNGQADSLQFYDDVKNRQAFIFSHAAYDYENWSIGAGASINQYRIRFQRSYPTPLPLQKRTFNNELAPRLSLMRKFKNANIYSSISKGFSSPATAEALPTGSAVNLDLNAEQGINYDLGFRGTLLKNLSVDFNAFLFRLNNSIVQRRDSSGGDYYINAGATRQRGIEISLRQALFQNTNTIRSVIWASYARHHFRYKDFKQLNTDFSGNALPGVAPYTAAAGIDFAHNHFTYALSCFFSSRVPLNDANTSYAREFYLVDLKLSYDVTPHKKLHTRLSAGVNNLLNRQYSLGNDINAFGGRFFNAAPGRNVYLSLSIQWLKKE